MGEVSITTERKQGHLQRKLGFWSLVFFGVIFMSPTSGLVYYPTTQPWSNGYSYLGYIVAAILIVLTVLSYQTMLKEFPETGSAYAYASKGINGKVGFIAGWILLIDYALVPLFCLKICSIYLEDIFNVPGWVFIVVIGAVVSVCCCLGVQIGIILELIIGVYVVLLALFFDFEAIQQMIMEGRPIFSNDVVYNSELISWSGVFNVAALGLLSFVGFDGITTLAEESKISADKMKLSLMVAVLLQAFFLISTTFLAAGGMDWTTIPEEELDVAYRYMLSVWTNPALSATLVVLQKIGIVALTIAAITSASRILFSMGRDKVLPQRFFGHLSPKFNTPVNSILLVGAITIVGALVLDWSIIAEVVSFGACVGFIAVNASVVTHFWCRKKEKKVLRNLIIPVIAALGIVWIMTTLSSICLTVGFIWTVVGLIYLGINYKRSQDFRNSINRGEIEGL